VKRTACAIVSFVFLLIAGGCAGDAESPALRAVWQRTIGYEHLTEAIGVATAGDSIYVSDSRQGVVLQFTQDGTLTNEWEHDAIARPMHIAAGPEGRIYVPDHLNDRVIVFDPDGEVLLEFGDYGTAPGQFDSPAGVAVGGDGSIYVADFNNHRVQKFDRRGRFVLEWGEKGHVFAGNFDYPTDVAIGPAGHVYVADAYNHRVQVFTPEGEHLQSIGSNGSENGEFNVAIGIAVDDRGRLFVADQFNHRVQIFDRDGAWLGAFGSEGSDRGEFDRPNDVAFDDNGRSYVADFGNGRVQVFTLEAVGREAAKEKEAWDETGASRSSLGRWWY